MEKKTTDPENVARECEYLSLKAKETARYNGWVIWSFELQEYFAQLREFCRAHNEMKEYLQSNYRDAPLIRERVEKLPDIEYKDYNRDLPGGQNALLILILYFFFPLAYFWMRPRIKYIDDTRDKLFQSHGLYSSIAFLIDKGIDQEEKE